MIRHAPAAAFPVVPLPVPVIEPPLRALLVPPVGIPPLLTARFLPAPVPAIDLPPVAGMANVKHRPATQAPAKLLPQDHFLGHCTPLQEWITAFCHGTSIGLLFQPCPGTGVVIKQTPDRSNDQGFVFLCAARALPKNLLCPGDGFLYEMITSGSWGRRWIGPFQL